MFELIKIYQLDIMLILCGSCGILVFLLAKTRFLSRKRKRILIFMELVALFLLWFDRSAYIYAGDLSREGYVMVRVSNFMVFFLTSGVVFGFNLYLTDLLKEEGKVRDLPERLKIIGVASFLGMMLSVIAAITNLYYYIDENNVYQRGPGFLIAYIIPILCPVIQYTVVRQYKDKFRKLIYISLVLYIWVPIFCGILQIFTYGISIVNMAMVAVSISLYFFMYLDLNDVVEHAHEIELRNVLGQNARMQRLFDQTATAFVSAVEKKDDFSKGKSLKTAEYAKKIAEYSGKSPDDCEKIYYAALLHDVGLIGLPDSVIKNEDDPDKWDYEAFREKPIIGSEILSSITEYPYLYEGARYSHERYNGSGYPEGLRGENIPEIARIIAVADAYVTMTTKKRYRDARPSFVAREALVKGTGEEFDPVYADIMIRIIDSEGTAETGNEPESEIQCREYREKITIGIPVLQEMTNISFDCEPVDSEKEFSAPSIVLFDSYDGRCHDNVKSIKSYNYLEYGEIWFDKYSVTTGAKRIKERVLEDSESGASGFGQEHYEILAGRYEDHLRLIMKSKNYSKEVIVALYENTKLAYIGITGENCRIYNIRASSTGQTMKQGDIPRITEPVSFIDHLESDVKNLQVDGTCSAYTRGIEIQSRVKLSFYTMTLPGGELVWNCPYVLLFNSDDGQVNGANYKEYAFIKLNGENFERNPSKAAEGSDSIHDQADSSHSKGDEDEKNELALNKFRMKKTRDFPGWDKWKSLNREGMECKVLITKKGNSIILKTENLGISIENITTINDGSDKIYAALTGDRVALTDIRLE